MADLVLTRDHLLSLYRADARLFLLMALALDNAPCGELHVTSLDRSRQKDRALGGSGVHCDGPPWRAVDLEGDLFQEQYEALAAEINAVWEYHAHRPQLNVAVGSRHGTGPHPAPAGAPAHAQAWGGHVSWTEKKQYLRARWQLVLVLALMFGGVVALLLWVL